MSREPIDFLTFIENNLQTADTERDEAQADVVDANSLLALTFFLQVGRILNEALGEIERKDTDRNVDVKDPAPAEIVGNPSAESWADGGRDDDGHAVHGESHAAFRRNESVGKNCLLAGLQPATGGALQHAEENQHAETWREPAQETASGKQGNAGHIETLATQSGCEPGTDGKHDAVGDEITG